MVEVLVVDVLEVLVLELDVVACPRIDRLRVIQRFQIIQRQVNAEAGLSMRHRLDRARRHQRLQRIICMSSIG